LLILRETLSWDQQIIRWRKIKLIYRTKLFLVLAGRASIFWRQKVDKKTASFREHLAALYFNSSLKMPLQLDRRYFDSVMYNQETLVLFFPVDP